MFTFFQFDFQPIYGGYYAWACPGVCYRTVGFYASNYQSPKFTISRTSVRKKAQFFSSKSFNSLTLHIFLLPPLLPFLSISSSSFSLLFTPHFSLKTLLSSSFLPGILAYIIHFSLVSTSQFPNSRPLIPNPQLSPVQDGASMTFPGYVNTFPNFLARTSYDVQMTPAPKWIQISYADPYGCTEPATFNLVLPNGYYWKFGYINKGWVCI